MLAGIMEKKYREYVEDIIANKISYKMKKENFELWLSYLKSHPVKATYRGFVGFKDNYKGDI